MKYKLKNFRFIYMLCPVHEIDLFIKRVDLLWTFKNGMTQAFFHKQVDPYVKEDSGRYV